MLFVSPFAFMACDDDDPAPANGPAITAPAAPTNVQTGAAADITFSVTVPGGYKSSAVAATGGTATKKSEPAAGAISGNVVVTFGADGTAGAGSVTLTVTDNGNATGAQTAIVNKTAEPVEETEIVVSANVTADATWETGKTYILASRIVVTDGATLTIEKGVVVKGEAGSGSNATALIIARGGKLMAQGTAEEPIIFTSIADEIQPGMIESPNLSPADGGGLWGGLIILGKAPISVSTGEQNFQIEGIPPSDTSGAYGGEVADDSSGEIRYISIRHGGANIGEGNEINGLTLGGVGSGTIIENVEVVSNEDDGIEWFGGTVSVTNALVWNAGDDAIDADQAWVGTLSNFIVLAGDETDHALEIDGPEGTYGEGTSTGHTITKGTIRGTAANELADFRDGARATVSELYFYGFPDPAASDGLGDFSLSGPETTDNFASDYLTFDKLEITLAEGAVLSTIFKNGTDVHASAVPAGSNTIGADKSAFEWTLAAVAGELNDL